MERIQYNNLNKRYNKEIMTARSLERPNPYKLLVVFVVATTFIIVTLTAQSSISDDTYFNPTRSSKSTLVHASLPILPLEKEGSSWFEALGGKDTRIIIFGDSWSDDATRVTPDESDSKDTYYDEEKYSGPRRVGPGFGGRWSNGIVWPEYLRDDLKCENYLNLAYGGAKITNNFVESPVPDLVDQYHLYLGIELPVLLEKYRLNITQLQLSRLDNDAFYDTPDYLNTEEKLQKNRKTLFSFWFGINDLIQYMNMMQDMTARIRAVEESIDVVFEITNRLATLHPQSNFLFVSTVDVTLLPIWSQRFLETDSHMVKYKEAVQLVRIWRKALSIKYSNWNDTKASAVFWDFDKWYRQQISGITISDFKNTKKSCFDRVENKLCDNPSDYLFWDSVHLTTAAHRLITDRLHSVNLFPSYTQWIGSSKEHNASRQ
ncbi:GDSL-like Lipase/Acylhydrolase-domain-containing protein [Dipodascopsis uninucleata]